MEQKQKKSPWRFAFAALSIISGFNLLSGLAAWLIADVFGGISFNITRASTIGIIGGADGPTAVFVTASTAPAWEMLLWLALLALAIYGLCRFRKK